MAVMDHYLSEWRAYVDRQAGPNRRGLAYVRGIPRVVEYFSLHPGVTRLHASLMSEGATVGHPAHAYVVQSYSRTHASFTRHVGEAVDDGDIPQFSPDEIEREAAQIALAFHGAVACAALQADLPPGVVGPPVVEVFTAFIDATVSRWQAARALGA